MINISRSATPPPSLLEKKVYRNLEILEALGECFHNKCYLTEQKFESPVSMEIDHFILVNEREDLKFEWTNLYLSSHYVNAARSRKTPEDGFLDPFVDNVEEEIIHHFPFIHGNPSFIPRNSSNIKAVNTCKELDRLHNGKELDKYSKERAKGLPMQLRRKQKKFF